MRHLSIPRELSRYADGLRRRDNSIPSYIGAAIGQTRAFLSSEADYFRRVLSANFGYDTGGTGNMTSLTTFQNPNAPLYGQVTGTGSATTNWTYDQSTGDLANKTFADGSKDTYLYNSAQQLTGMTTPSMFAASFSYNNAGERVSSLLYAEKGEGVGDQIAIMTEISGVMT